MTQNPFPLPISDLGLLAIGALIALALWGLLSLLIAHIQIRRGL
jgi:hypothetical protein